MPTDLFISQLKLVETLCSEQLSVNQNIQFPIEIRRCRTIGIRPRKDRDNDNDPSHYEAGIAVTGTLMDSFRIDKALQGNIHFQVF